MISSVGCCSEDLSHRIEYKNYVIIYGVGEYVKGDENKKIYCGHCCHPASIVTLHHEHKPLELWRGYGHGVQDECKSWGCTEDEKLVGEQLKIHVVHLREQKFNNRLQVECSSFTQRDLLPKNFNTYYYLDCEGTRKRFKFLKSGAFGYRVLKCNCVKIKLVPPGINEGIHSGE
jgi:hypothetical protein